MAGQFLLTFLILLCAAVIVVIYDMDTNTQPSIMGLCAAAVGIISFWGIVISAIAAVWGW